jgi:hypothetical protein
VIVLGGVLSAVGWAAFVGGFIVMGTNLFEMAGDGLDLRGSLEGDTTVPGSAEIELDEGRYHVLALGPQLTHRVQGGPSGAGDAIGHHVERLPFTEPAVTVTGPDGGSLDLATPGVETLYDTPGIDGVAVAELVVPADGTYVLTGDLGEGAAAGEVTHVGIGEATDLADEIKESLAVGVVITLGGLAGGFGMVLLVGGVIWYAVSR